MSGFTVLAYEVLWTRALNFVIGNSVYAFTTVLVVTPTGLFLGAFVAGPLADRSRAPLRTIGWIRGLAALATIAALSVAGYLPRLTTALVDRWGAGSPLGDILSKVVPAAAALLLPTLLSGVTFPFLLRTATTRFEGLGGRLGSGYALNTVGAIVVSLAAGFALLPALGTTRGILAIIFVQMAMGTIFLLRSEGTRPRRILSGLSLAATLAVFVATLVVRPAPLIRYARSATGGNSEILFWQEGRTASVSVVRAVDTLGRETQRFLFINLLGAATTSPARRNEQYYTLLSALPSALHPSPRKAFVAGGASGVTTGAAALDDRTERVVSVEISPEVTRAAALFSASNYDAVNHPRIELIADDARAYLATTDERFDIIVTDCFLSAVTGTAALYSREYFDLCRSRLAPGGFMSIGADRLRGVDRVVVRTFLESFPYAALFLSPDPSAYCVSFLIGANEPFRFSRATIEAALQQPLLGRELASYAFTGIDVLEQSYVCGHDRLLDFVSDGEICSDDRPVIDFQALAWAEGFRAPKQDDQAGAPGVRRLVRAGRDPFPWAEE